MVPDVLQMGAGSAQECPFGVLVSASNAAGVNLFCLIPSFQRCCLCFPSCCATVTGLWRCWPLLKRWPGQPAFPSFCSSSLITLPFFHSRTPSRVGSEETWGRWPSCGEGCQGNCLPYFAFLCRSFLCSWCTGSRGGCGCVYLCG
jgi:hypothetical protein